MGDVDPAPRVPEPTSDLQMAAGISGCEKLSAGGVDVTDLPAQECLCLIGLCQRVHAGAATAPGRFREFDGRHAWKLTEQRARLRRDLLAVHEVTRIVIRNRDGVVERRGARRAAADLD